MAVANAAQSSVKTVADPCATYESLADIWKKCRAVCNGERFVKDYDSVVDRYGFRNLLIPFSPSMTEDQYRFYKAEAELPGITAQFSKMIVGGLLRKPPLLTLPDSMAPDVHDWIINEFNRDDSPLVSFLDNLLWEELQTSRSWIFVDYPMITNPENLTREELLSYKPFPVLHKAENIINWRVSEDSFGKAVLDRVIVKGLVEKYTDNEFHPEYYETVWVHDLDDSGYYRIRVYQRKDEKTNVPVIAGFTPVDNVNKVIYELVDEIATITMNGNRLRFIPAWPANGNIEPIQPVMSPIIDKEIALYNKISRRNHLLYGAATYTPIIISDMSDEEFDGVVNAGLGSWLHLRQGDDAKVLETPSEALQDMDRAIAASIEEMAKLGIRMLTPETDQSGIALEIRNAAQTAQLGSLNNQISNTMKGIIAFMINWRVGSDLSAQDVEFSLSEDFNPVPLGADWLRLATEWYQQGLIPRSIWLSLLKHNDMISPDYDDEKGKEEISENMELIMGFNEDYTSTMEKENASEGTNE